jgi:tetratricopeptide (TPR) repeat protein
MRDRGDLKAAADWYAQALAELKPLYDANSRDISARQYLAETYEGRAYARSLEGRPADALADMDRALQLTDDSNRPNLQAGRALCLARGGQVDRAIEEAKSLLEQKDLPSLAIYNLACVYAVSASKVGTDKDRDTYTGRAVGLLRRAIKEGFRDVGMLKEDRDLDVLRKRAELQQLIKELEAKTTSSKTP